MLIKSFITNSSSETQKLGEYFLKNNFFSCRFFLLEGELGAGKTTFLQGLAKSLGIKKRVLSPTFLIWKKYPLPKKNVFLYHLDAYRLTNLSDLREVGILNAFLSESKSLFFCEWGEKIKLPDFFSCHHLSYGRLTFSYLSPTKRKIKIEIFNQPPAKPLLKK